MNIRRPVVAGGFYPAEPDRLKQSIKASFLHKYGPGGLPNLESNQRHIVSVVAPHAGYVYSGYIAAHVFYHLASEPKPDKIIILCPNHTGLGGKVSLSSNDYWETPLGLAEVDANLARDILNASNIIDMNETAHMHEHSIEVQLPFLQYIYGDFKFVPVCMGYQDLNTSIKLGEAIAEVLKGSNSLIFASTDLTHQEPLSSAKSKDDGVIKNILNMDEKGLQNWVHSKKVSMCGYGPVSATIIASRKLGALKAELLSYGTSGDAYGDYSSVVGYTSIKMVR